MVIDPNSSETVTGAIMESARRGASSGTELIGVTIKGGTRNVDSAFGDYLSGAVMIRTCLEAVSLHKPDAVVLAGFGRVGIDALKEALVIPVVCISELIARCHSRPGLVSPEMLIERWPIAPLERYRSKLAASDLLQSSPQGK